MSLLTSSSRSSSSFHSTAQYSSSCPLDMCCMKPCLHYHTFSSFIDLHSPPLSLSVSFGSSLMGRPSSISSPGAGGGVRCYGDMYFVSVDVSQFEPQDVVVMAYNQHIVIQAAKVLDGGTVGDTFTHKFLLPEDMDPLSVSGAVGSDGVLVVSVNRNCSLYYHTNTFRTMYSDT
uniref:SHSP domain-containing protein n=1 Tax=Periophthalmus magnuspinnatus TaxID=409849 RepID=A0A3B4A845_9GOBI